MVLNIIKNITINTLKYKYHLQKLKENGSSFSIAGNIIKSNDLKSKFGSEINTSVISGILEILLGLSAFSSVTNIVAQVI